MAQRFKRTIEIDWEDSGWRPHKALQYWAIEERIIGKFRLRVYSLYPHWSWTIEDKPIMDEYPCVIMSGSREPTNEYAKLTCERALEKLLGV